MVSKHRKIARLEKTIKSEIHWQHVISPDTSYSLAKKIPFTFKKPKRFIGSTTCFIHDRVREHLNSEHSSVKKHISTCQNKDYKGIEIKNIVLENDPVNPRLFEAFYIRKYQPTLNSLEECSEFADLLF